MSASFNIGYKASPTCGLFIKDRSPLKILAGPVGGGKTSAAIIHILMNAMEQAPDNDGIRRSRHLIIRNTVPMLKTTTIKSFLDWIPDGTLGKYMISDKTYLMKFADVEAEVLFFPLEDVNDIRRMLSLETTTAFFNEFREINPDIVEALIGTKRIGRYPSRKNGPGATYPCIFADTNMPAMDSWHQQVMDGVIPGWKLFKQPSGRSSEAENLQFLPPDYYNTDGLSEEYIKTMIDVEYGQSKEGLPVFRSTFVPSFHISTTPLIPLRSTMYPVIIGVDAGLTPAAVLFQQTPNGPVNVLAEAYTPKGESSGMERFLQVKLLPLLRSALFAECTFLVVVDPAATQRSQPTEETVYDIITKARLKCIPGPTQDIDLRIGSMETLLARQVGGKAGLSIDAGCTGLIAAMRYGYKYAAKRDGELEEKPAKLHPDSDIADAGMYATSYLVGASRFTNMSPALPVVTPQARGWT